MLLYASVSLSTLLILIFVTLLALSISIILSICFLGRNRRSKPTALHHVLVGFAYILTLVSLVFSIFCGGQILRNGSTLSTEPSDMTDTQPSTQGLTESPTTEPTFESTVPPTTVPTEPPTEPTEPKPSLGEVTMTDQSNPENWSVSWEISLNDQAVNFYNRSEAITFGDPNEEAYFALPGIATFRGDNYRTGAAYGVANITEKKLTTIWTSKIGSLAKGSSSGYWTGCGWTGQPLVVEWDAETKQIMNLYESKKTKEGLVEVIYATLDGKIYFYDLEDGSYTRDPLNIGMTFKGAGALDPRGYPIMYVGSGDTTSGGKVPRMYIINLIDCSIMYESGNKDSRYRNWVAFDSSPLVDAETDTLIWPGESGILYTMKLNTQYDKAAGTLSIAPDEMVKTRYQTSTGYTLGYEASSIIVENYLYVADNGGMLFCIDLNTMALVWSQFTKDDNNATPVFEWGDDGVGYLYIATSMENCDGSVYVYKINASNGEIVWEVEFDNVYYNYSVSGGVLSSPVLGKKGTALEGMLIYAIAKTPGAYNGILVALDTDTGETIWKKSMNHYAWSSPVAVYTETNDVYLVICDSGGYVHLMNAVTGESYTKIGVGSNVEASPIIYNDMLVVGTRGQQVYGIKLS